MLALRNPPIWWPEPDPILEAQGATPAGRAQRANRAGQDVVADYRTAEQQAVDKLARRLQVLKQSLQARLLGETATDFKRYTVSQLVADVDRMIADTSQAIAQDAQPVYTQAVQLGIDAADQPMHAAQLNIRIGAGLPGLDATLVQIAFDQTADLLTEPMQQFRGLVVSKLRGVALAGDGTFGAIKALRDSIQGQGFDNAQFRAERIIRTELGRTFNASTYARLTALAGEFPFLRKGWRAAKDGRTRKGHREAAATYARGQGIPMAARFVIQVYDERNTRGRKGNSTNSAKLLGTAQLRFPVDPEATPAGRLAAGATIMCRCNAFVDFEMAAFAEFTRAKVATALTGVEPPAAPAPAPPPPAPPVVPKPARVPKPRLPKVPKPTVPVGVPAHKVPVPTIQPVGPNGPKVSGAVTFQTARIGKGIGPLPLASARKVVAALEEIDKVHGDGVLPRIPAGTPRQRGVSGAAAYYMHARSTGESIEFGFGAKILKTSPYMGVFHETGHFLDHKGLGRALGLTPTQMASEAAFAGTVDRAAFDAVQDLRDALKNSKTYQTMRNMLQANVPGSGFANGDGTIPADWGTKNREIAQYMVSSRETFARAYAQYMTVKSGNAAALAELRKTQQAARSSVDGVPATARRADMSAGWMGVEVPAGRWSFPWAWQDDEFQPIEAAFDRLFGVVGWRK